MPEAFVLFSFVQCNYLRKIAGALFWWQICASARNFKPGKRRLFQTRKWAREYFRLSGNPLLFHFTIRPTSSSSFLSYLRKTATAYFAENRHWRNKKEFVSRKNPALLPRMSLNKRSYSKGGGEMGKRRAERGKMLLNIYGKWLYIRPRKRGIKGWVIIPAEGPFFVAPWSKGSFFGCQTCLSLLLQRRQGYGALFHRGWPPKTK